MPTKVTRNGKTYTEYTPQEIDAIRLAKIIAYQERHGPGRQQVSPLVGGSVRTIFLRRTNECQDTRNMNK